MYSKNQHVYVTFFCIFSHTQTHVCVFKNSKAGIPDRKLTTAPRHVIVQIVTGAGIPVHTPTVVMVASRSFNRIYPILHASYTL